ncbi:IgGFc-binding protein [Hoylesella saccharolytica]|uniref:IgGFc-binding protein n=1 Tax=Hoylesella saccharolytica TaxID=633701 RepID=UPI0028D17B0A|nr:IgGFc-binding protein [Hoylesella saccharolytica]
MLLFLFSIHLFSQGQSTTQGKEFWLSYGKNYTYSALPNLLQLRIVATKPTKVTLIYTLDNSTETINVAAGEVYTRVFDASDAAKIYSDATGTTKKSLHIISDELISVFAINIYKHTTDATNVLPVTNYGKVYRHMTYSATGNDGYTLIAAENDTHITENKTSVAVLQKGEVYSKYVSGGDMTGTLITSDKPIAYFTTASCVNVPNGTGACDCLFQQQVPVHSWGNKFLVPLTKRGKERIRVVASQDGTTITQTGATIISHPGTGSLSLNAGQFVELEAALSDGGCYLQSDKPIAVASFLMGLDYPDLYKKGDPAMAWVPPIEQTVMNVAIAPFIEKGTSVLEEHHALIVTPTATKNATTMRIGNGAPKALSGGTWTDNVPSGFSFYSMPLTNETATYYFENAAGLSVMGYGLGPYESYYYLAASSARQLNPAFYINDIHFEDANEQTYCAGEFKVRGVAQMQLAGGSDDITWFIDNVEQTAERGKLEWTIPSLSLNTPHEIKMVVKAAYNEVFTLTTKITVVDPKPLKISGDPYICPPAQSTTLKAESGPARYQWFFNGDSILGETKQEYTVTKDKAGKYTVIGYYGKCQSPMSDTVTVIDGCKAILKMAYDGNGYTSGSVPSDENSPYPDNAEVTVKGRGDLARTEAAFIGWSFTKRDEPIAAKSDVPTDLKQAGDKFHISSDTTLYATWAVDKTGPQGKSDTVPDYLQNGVTYNGNGSNSGAAPVDPNRYNANTEVTLKGQESLKRDSAVFIGWSFTQASLVTTQSAEPSDLKQKDSKFTITADTTFFAVWAIDKTGPDGKPDDVPDYKQAGLVYDGNGNTGGTVPTDPKRYNDGNPVTVIDKGSLVHKDATFLGWHFEKKSVVTKKSEVPDSIRVAGSTFAYSPNRSTLYAVWGEDKTGPNGKSDDVPDYLQHGVTYDGNDNTSGTAPEDPNRYNDNTEVTLKGQNDLKHDTAVFIGWSFKKVPVVTSQAAEPNDLKQANGKFTITSDTTLYAVWAIDKTGPGGKPDGKPDYGQNGVVYYGNENTGGVAPTDGALYNDGDDVTVKEKGSLVREKAAFLGWLFEAKPLVTKKSEVPTDIKKPNDKYKYSKNASKLYAVWAEDKTGPNGTSDDVPDYLQMGVTYEGNKSDGGAAPKDPKRYNDGDNVTLLGKGDLTRTEATFIGWSFSAQELIKTKAEQDAVTDLKKPTETFAITTDTTVYAVWAEDKTGPNGTPDDVPDYLQMGVTYNGNENTSGTAPKDPKRYNSGSNVTLLDKADLARTEAAFIGWSFTQAPLVTTQSAEPSDLKQKDSKFTITADTTLFAVWAVDKTGPSGKPDGNPDYKQAGVKYFANGATGTVPTDDNLYNDSSDVTVKDKGDLTLSNTMFLGWLFEQKSVITKRADAPDESDLLKANATFKYSSAHSKLYATWAEDKTGPNGHSDEVPDYLQMGVTYNGNGGTGAAPVDPNRYNKDDQVTVKGQGDLKRDRVVFIGWSFTQKDSITSKAEEDSIGLMKPNATFPISADTTLFAVWAKDANNNGIPDYDEVYVTWHPGAQLRKLGKPTPKAVAKGPYKLTTQGYSVPGWVLIGWSNLRTSPVKTKAVESSIKPLSKVGESILIGDQDMTLYAVWAIDQNNDGVPDYRDNAGQLKSGRASLLRGNSEEQDKASFEATEVRVWAHEGMLYIESDHYTRADIYTRSGALYQRINVAEGLTSQPLASGFYVVAIDGKRYKVLVK